jgi:transcriptional regulator with XRE-family HTH domain
MITGPQIRAARALLGWSLAELSRQSGISASAIHRFENGHHDSRESTLAAIQTALVKAGVEFIGLLGVKADRNEIQSKRRRGLIAGS